MEIFAKLPKPETVSFGDLSIGEAFMLPGETDNAAYDRGVWIRTEPFTDSGGHECRAVCINTGYGSMVINDDWSVIRARRIEVMFE